MTFWQEGALVVTVRLAPNYEVKGIFCRLSLIWYLSPQGGGVGSSEEEAQASSLLALLSILKSCSKQVIL